MMTAELLTSQADTASSLFLTALFPLQCGLLASLTSSHGSFRKRKNNDRSLESGIIIINILPIIWLLDNDTNACVALVLLFWFCCFGPVYGVAPWILSSVVAEEAAERLIRGWGGRRCC
jgi:hypothetical protein